MSYPYLPSVHDLDHAHEDEIKLVLVHIREEASRFHTLWKRDRGYSIPSSNNTCYHDESLSSTHCNAVFFA